MARAINRLRKQVAGRRPDAHGYVTTHERLLNLETTVLEMLAFHVKQLEAHGQDPAADALVQAANDFKRTLEKVLAT